MAKFKYINIDKLDYNGTQLKKGDMIDRKNLNGLPANWFEEVKAKVKKTKTTGGKQKWQQ